MAGMACLHPRNVPSTFTALTKRQFSKLTVSMSSTWMTPALFTRTSSRPNCSSDRRHERAPLVLVADVLANEDGVASDLPSGLLALLVVDIGQHHATTLAGEHDGVGLAQPVGGARHDAHLAVDPSHQRTPP